MAIIAYNQDALPAQSGNATEHRPQELHRGDSVADCTKKSADVAQSVSTSPSKTRKVNPHAAVRKTRRERYKAAREAIRESFFQAGESHLPSDIFDCVSPSVTREERFFISQECGVATVDDGEGWFAYQQRTPRPRVLSHEGDAAVLFAQAEAEQKRQAEERNRELGYGKFRPRGVRSKAPKGGER